MHSRETGQGPAGQRKAPQVRLRFFSSVPVGLLCAWLAGAHQVSTDRLLRDFRLEIRKSAIPGEFDATLASDTPVRRDFGMEVLSFDSGAVDLSRASEGLPLLLHHDPTQLVGRVHGVRVEGGRLRGRLKFFDNGDGREAAAMVTGGHRELSIGYLIVATAERAGNVVVTRWTPYEASVVAIPADHKVGINRSHSMSDRPSSRHQWCRPRVP